MSQKKCIKRDLLRGKKISPLSALRNYGCLRLAARIFELRGEGIEIETDTRYQAGKSYAVYKLKPDYDQE